MIMFPKMSIESFNGISERIPAGELAKQDENKLIPTLERTSSIIAIVLIDDILKLESRKNC